MDEELQNCPLITSYTDELEISHSTLEKLFVLRKWDLENGGPIPLAWPSLLRKNIPPEDKEFFIRNYQLQQVHHLCRMPTFIVGDAVGLGKTIDVIVAACWLKERFPKVKFVIVATKSATLQWKSEIERFSFLRARVLKDNYKGLSGANARYSQFIDFFEGDDADVMITKYSSMVGVRKKIEGKFDEDGNPVKGREKISQEVKNFAKIFQKHRNNIIIAFDEAHKFKGLGTNVRTLVKVLSRYSGKVWALTATAIKNGLDEFYSILVALGLEPLGPMSQFYEDFCIFRNQYVGMGISKPVLMGYKNVPLFRQVVRPFFLGRSQSQVKEPMPHLSTYFHPVDLDAKQVKILTDELPNGTLELPPTLIKRAGEIFEKSRDLDNLMTQMSIQQLTSNHWCLIDKTSKDFLTKTLSPKEEAALDMLDGEYRGEKVIVYTKFKSWIDRLEKITKSGDWTERPFLRITGEETEIERDKSKQLFQDPNSGYDLIVIDDAGLESINLQQAAHLFCLDLPWSWGNLLQLVGRMVRMASPHSACTLRIFLAKGTIDEYTVETLRGKKGVFEVILGQSHSAGILDTGDFELNLDSGMESAGSEEEFLSLLKAHVKSSSVSDFLKGGKILSSQTDEEYKMSFEKDAKKKKKTFDMKDFEDKWG